MQEQYSTYHSENLVFIGAGSTSSLGIPTTSTQSKFFRKLAEAKNEQELSNLLTNYFLEPDLSKIIAFLKILEVSDSIFNISNSDIKNASHIFNNKKEDLLKKRIIELRLEYDWNAAKKIIKICPEPLDSNNDNLIFDLYSIIDNKLLTKQSLNPNIDESTLPLTRLNGARNFLILLTNMLISSAWFKITIGEKEAEFEKYKNFIIAFDHLMLKEGFTNNSVKNYKKESRDFYLFSTSFVSFNFDMVFPWIFMNSHYTLNHNPVYIQNHPLKLWLDYNVEHRGRKINNNNKIIPTLEFTESVASRENEDDHIGTPINRAGKFYFAHGSANWRECPACGRLTFYFGTSEKKWNFKSSELIPPFPIPLFKSEQNIHRTEKEYEWQAILHNDSLQCMHCGQETKTNDSPMIMQTIYKSTPTSFLEEIQRNVKIELKKASHIILLGYSLPKDDVIWYHTFSEAVRSRINSNKEAFCTIVIGYKGKNCYLYGDELLKYIKSSPKDDEAFGINAIINCISIFGLSKVRAWTGGIPQVFGKCTEADVKELFYPNFEQWKNFTLPS